MHLPVARSKMGGGAISMWRTAESLKAHGVPVRVTAASIQAIQIRGQQVRAASADDLGWADIVVTVPSALRFLSPAVRAVRRGKPVVCFVHSAVRPVKVAGASLMVWASASLRARAMATGFEPYCPEMVVWPPIDAEAVRTTPGNSVTLVNLQVEKGARLFYAIARLLPDVPFLGVRGGWGLQVVERRLPKNVTVAPFAADPRDVYGRTKVLLYMRGPRSGPGWLNGVGMTALEAACSGIPTVAHPGPGLIEALGDAGTFVDSDNPEEWAAAIRGLLDPVMYAERSTAAWERSTILDPDGDTARLISAMEALMPASVR